MFKILLIKQYCRKEKYDFLMSSTEYAFKGSDHILLELIKNLKKYDGILFYSFLKIQIIKKRLNLYKNIFKKKRITFRCRKYFN